VSILQDIPVDCRRFLSISLHNYRDI